MDGDFRVNMYWRVGKKITDQTSKRYKLSDKEENILELLENDPNLTQVEIADKLGWIMSRIKYNMGRLQKKGILIRAGTGRKGSWHINTSNTKAVIKRDSR